MIETAAPEHSIPRSQYKNEVPQLRTELLAAQDQLAHARFPVLVVFGGVAGAGKSETINLLNQWLDPRGIVTHAFDAPSQEERERPEYWRYWLSLPPKGKIGMYLSGWYESPLHDFAYSRIDRAAFAYKLDRIAAFERELADDGALLLKFWIHIDRDAQEQRLRTLEQDPLTSWRVTPREKETCARYDDYAQGTEQLLQRTGAVPWQVVAGADPNFRTLTVASTISGAITKRLAGERKRRQQAVYADELGELPRVPNVLTQLDMNQQLAKKNYRLQLEKYQGQLYRLVQRAREQNRSTILVFEGADAAGKGGTIRRLTAALEARDFQVIPIAAPTDEEHAQPYLWRFWRHLPRAGRVTIFDRSWYGRVLVERIEGFACRDEWQRAYSEINDFERQLVEHGIVLAKFWIHIDKDEQFQRFKDRQVTPYKRWKMTEEDWRNREKWDHYEAAVDDMVARTDTDCAPWTLVEGNDKRFARVKVIRTLCERLQQALDA